MHTEVFPNLSLSLLSLRSFRYFRREGNTLREDGRDVEGELR